MIVMFTAGVAVHVVVWTIALEYVHNSAPSEPIQWPPTIIGFIVLCVGSFLILTSLLIVVEIATGVL